MSVTGFTELFMERGGKKDLSTTEVHRVFQVFTDTMLDGPLTVMSAPGLPQPGSLHPDDPTLRCVSLDPSPDVDGVTWKVKANYEPKPPGDTQGEDNPWDLDPVINFGFVSRAKVMERCYSVNKAIPGGGPPGDPARGLPEKKVTNSLLQPFDPPHMIEEYLLLIAISRNVKHTNFVPSTSVQKYQYTTNKDQVVIAGITLEITQGLCRDFKSTKAWTGNNTAYWQQTIEIIVNLETWVQKIVDMGILIGDNPSSVAYVVYSPIKDDEGNQLNEPVLLNGAMARLPANQDPVTIDFHAIWEETWTGWLPTTY